MFKSYLPTTTIFLLCVGCTVSAAAQAIPPTTRILQDSAQCHHAASKKRAIVLRLPPESPLVIPLRTCLQQTGWQQAWLSAVGRVKAISLYPPTPTPPPPKPMTTLASIHQLTLNGYLSNQNHPQPLILHAILSTAQAQTWSGQLDAATTVDTTDILITPLHTPPSNAHTAHKRMHPHVRHHTASSHQPAHPANHRQPPPINPST
jgi:predicted DNA-binding protein with PD1-like motif